jgi:hypothetical protein
MDVTLKDFDNHLMDGLDFCKKVYDSFEQIRRGIDGTKRLRLRRSQLEKKLIEELIPIARYVQARYSHGRRLKVRWLSGGQQYDARLLSSGALVDNGLVPKRQFLEVTTAVHEKDHYLRRLLDEQVPTFGVKGIAWDPKTKKPISRPHAYRNTEAQADLSARIIQRIMVKNKIDYPRRTVLVIQCFLDRLILEDEWQQSIEEVRRVSLSHRFEEVFVFDSNYHYSATLHGSIHRRRQ